MTQSASRAQGLIGFSRKRNLNLLVVAAAVLVQLSAQAQKRYTVSGYITEAGSRENLPGATVYQPNSNNATSSNAYGFYSITLPASDTLQLAFVFVGYRAQIQRLKLDKDIVLNVDLQPENVLQEVEVVAKKNEAISEDVQMSKIDLPVEKVKDIPALLGEKDVLKVLQLMPGIQKGNEGSAGFYVRGGGPDQNLIILDDATVYNAFHLFGFFSLFNGDALKSIELTKGGFPARYGGRLSSVLDMQMKDGNKEKISGEVGIGIISSRLTLEGPILKNKLSFLVSGRRTYIDALIRPFQRNNLRSGYYFYDLNAKLNYIISNKDRLYLSGYFGEDRFSLSFKEQSYNTRSLLAWGNLTGTLRWNHLFSNKLFANTSLIVTDYNLKIEEDQRFLDYDFSLRYKSGIRDYTFKVNFDWMPLPRQLVKFGWISTYHRFRPGASVVKSEYMGQNESSQVLVEAFEHAAFIEDDWTLSSRWRVNAGLRVSAFTVRSQTYVNPEPRLSFRYKIVKDLSLKGGYTIMNQYMHLLSNTGVGLPTDLWVPATEKARYMSSQQGALGLALDIPGLDMDLALEGYYKDMNNVLGYREGASFLEVGGSNKEALSWEDNVTSGRGWSYGGELLIRKNAGKFSGWIGYTLSWTQLQFDGVNNGNKFYARYDRRHDISVVGVYKLNKRFTLSATWIYGTGNAITLPLSTYAANLYANPLLGQEGALNQAFRYNLVDYGSQRNAFRMSPYHRLDIGIRSQRDFKKYSRVIEFSIYNAYNRKNPFFYFITTLANGKEQLQQVSLFPLIPSISATWKF